MGSKAKRIKLSDRTLENDIKYRAPLSYRHLRMFGWLFLVLAQISKFLELAAKIKPELDYGILTTAISTLSSLVVPLFLIANFTVILTSQDNYKNLLINYAIFMVGTTLVFFFFYEHIIGGLFKAFIGKEDLVFEREGSLLLPDGYIAFNLFLDLFLCSLFIFFLDYTPQKVFVGKKVIIFRLMALLPIVYEVICIVIKIKAAGKMILLSPFAFPFLTTKPPMSFLAFVLLGLTMFRMKRKFMKKGKTLKEYHEYLKTNAHSLQFSIKMAIIFVFVSILDVLVLLAIVSLFVVFGDPTKTDLVGYYMNLAISCGFGDSIVLIILAPIVLLYSYNRKPKNGMIDNAIPVFGIVGCILVYIEGIYRIVLLIASKYSAIIEIFKNYIKL